jgi:hypothetical protein
LLTLTLSSAENQAAPHCVIFSTILFLPHSLCWYQTISIYGCSSFNVKNRPIARLRSTQDSKTLKYTSHHLCFEWDSHPRSQSSSGPRPCNPHWSATYVF